MNQCPETADQHADLLAVSEVMTGLRFPGAEWFNLFRGKQVMIESPVIKRWQAEANQRLILVLLKERFKKVPGDVDKRLREIQDERKLAKLIVVASQCANLDAFREALTS